MQKQAKALSAGHIDICISTDQQSRISECTISNLRPKDIGSLLTGLSAEQALQRIPTLFMLCSQAQQVAAFSALSAVQGSEITEQHTKRIATGCALEWLKEHSWQLWQMERELFGQDYALQQSIGLSRHLLGEIKKLAPVTLSAEQVSTETDWNPIRQLFSSLFSIDVQQFTQLSMQELQSWSEKDAPYPRLMQELLKPQMREFGAFSGWDISGESGSIYRQQNHPLLQQAIEQWGGSIASRTLARLLEIALICQKTELTLSAVTGTAKASRGDVTHKVSLSEQGVITHYQIDAPTDRYFTKNGLVQQSLIRQSLPDLVRARLLIWAIDPCVEFNIVDKQSTKGELNHA